MLINIDGTVLSYIQCSVEVLSADLVQDGKVHSLYQLWQFPLSQELKRIRYSQW